jgi:predicted transcriptional regulator
LEELNNLLFELADENRLTILMRLQEKPMKPTRISEELGLNGQEASMHLSRLSEAGFIVKDTDGSYSIQPFGEEILTLLHGFEFLSKNRNYFNEHDISGLPLGFRNRIGELKTCSLSNDVSTSVHLMENVVREAGEYLWMISDQVLTSTKRLIDQAMKARTTKFRIILPENIIPTPGFEPQPFTVDRMERRVLKGVDITMVMSEKEAQLAFRAKDHKMDLRTFSVFEPTSMNWCKDLYEYYWNKAIAE